LRSRSLSTSAPSSAPEGSVTIIFDMTIIPSAIPLPVIYSVFVDSSNSVHTVMYTRCGLRTSTVSRLASYTSDQLKQFADSNGRIVTLTLSGLSIEKIYGFSVLVELDRSQFDFELPPSAYTTYQPIHSVYPIGYRAPTDSTNHVFTIVAIILVPLILVCAGGIGYLFWRNRKLSKQLEDAVEMPDVLTTSLSSGGSSRRGDGYIKRGRDNKVSDEGGEDYSVMISDETDDENRRYSRRSRKTGGQGLLAVM